MTQPARHRVEEFDGLRGVAILCVMLHHMGLYHRWRVGPDLFFVLSGYLTTRSLRDHAGSRAWSVLLAFHHRRILRLWPPLLVLLAFVCPLIEFLPEVGGEVRRDLLAALTFTMNWQQALTSWESASVPHLWSLAAEQQFYLIWPLLLLACPRGWTKPLLVMLVCAVVCWRLWLYGQGAGFNRLYFGLDSHADALVAGCLLAVTEVPLWLEPGLQGAGLASLCALTLAGLTLPAETPFEICLSTTLTTGLATLVVAAAPLGGMVGRIFAYAPLRAVGRMSYSLYLWNFPIVAFYNPRWSHGVKIAQLVVVGAVSLVAYVTIEKPLAAHFKARRRRADAAAAQGSAGVGRGPRWRPAIRLPEA